MMRLIIGLVLALAVLGCDKTIREVRHCAGREQGAGRSCLAASPRQPAQPARIAAYPPV